MYYIAAKINNKRNRPITVKWMQGKNEKHLEIESNASKTIEFVMPKVSFPETLNLTAFDKENGYSIDIRGRRFFEVIPRLERTVDEITIR